MGFSEALLREAGNKQDDEENVDSMISGLMGAAPAPAPPPPDDSADALVADFAPKEPEGGGAETPAAPATTGTTQQTPSRSAASAAFDWISGLLPDNGGAKLNMDGVGSDPDNPNNSGAYFATEASPWSSGAGAGQTAGTFTGLAAGGIDGATPLVGTKALVRPFVEDRNETDLGLPPENSYLQWDAKAQDEHPVPYAVGQAISSTLLPWNRVINGLAAPFRAVKGDGILRGIAKVGGNALGEGLSGGLSTASHEYADTGHVNQNDVGLGAGISAAISGLLGSVGMTAERYGARNGTPDALGLKDLDQREMRLNAAGMPNSDIDALKQSPEKFKAMSDEANRLADENFGDRFLGSYTPRDNYLVAKKAAEENRAAKDVLAEQIADAGGSARPADVAEEMRNYAGNKFAVGAPGDKDSIKTIDDIANGYEDWPRLHHQKFGVPPAGQLVLPGVPSLPPTAAAQGLPPPPLPAGPPALTPGAVPTLSPANSQQPMAAVSGQGLPPSPARVSARAPGPAEIAEADLMPVRASARFDPANAPQPGSEEAALSALAGMSRPEIDQGLNQRTQAFHDANASSPEWRAAQKDDPRVLAEDGMLPDDMGQLMEQEMQQHFEASPGNLSPEQLMERELLGEAERAPNMTPAGRPSTRYQTPAADDGWLPRSEVQGSGQPSARYNPATDPSAQGMPPPPLPAGPPPLPSAGPGAGLPNSGNAAAGLPPPAAGVPQAALPPPGPANSNNAAISALAAASQPPSGPVGPMQGPPQLLQTQGPPQLMPQREVPGLPTDEVPFMQMNKKRINAGAPLEIGVPPKPENAFNRLEYSLLNDAQQAGANRAGPGWGDQWAQLKRQEGLQNPLAEAGYMYRSQRRPLDRSDLLLAGLGAGAVGGKEYSDGEDSFGTGALKTGLGAAAGIAASRFLGSRGASIAANFLSKDTEGMSARLGQRVSQTPTGSLAGSLRDDMTKASTTSLDSDPDGNAPSGYTPGQLLGRRTSAAMRSNSSLFMPWAEDFQREQTDDGRAAVVERLLRTDQARFQPAYDFIMRQKNITSSDPGGP